MGVFTAYPEQGKAVTQRTHCQGIEVEVWYEPEAIFQLRKERESNLNLTLI